MDAPVTTPPPANGRRFVVQRHRATRLHYDLRLEMGGVLVSWAVPKGPTLDPSVRRLAVHVDDHDVAGFAFEGVHEGGSDKIVWDWGTWTPAAGTGDPVSAVAAGELHADLAGERLHGRFAFIRSNRGGPKDEWLLIHKHDAHAVEGWDAEQFPTSVKTGRTNDEVVAEDG